MISHGNRPIRIAHVVAGMNLGGIENWLMALLRQFDRRRFQFDFITHRGGCCAHDEELLALGSKLFRCPSPSRPWAYGSELMGHLRRHGPYDVIHSHLHHYNGFVLRLGRLAGVPLRIAHVHSDTSGVDARARLLRRMYLRGTHRWIDRHATLGFAPSEAGGAAFFPSWRIDPRWRLLYCGIDTDGFRAPLDRPAMRRQLGLPPESLVLGHVGNFREPKNHGFLVDVAAAVVAREPRAHLVLVGDGPLRPQIEEKVRRLNIADRVVFTGAIDARPVLRAAMDVFVFPSLWEGLGLAAVEAQAAGVPCVVSDAVPSDGAVAAGLVERIPLSAPVDCWAETVLRMATQTPKAVRDAGLAQVESSPLNARNSVRILEETYVGR